MPKEQHLYKPGATFSKVMMLYRFDKKLRLLLFNEIEKIEVAVRSAIVKHGCEVTGDPFWMTNPNNFSNPVKFNKTISLIEDELNHSEEECITHFKEAYSDPFPPAWMLSEILPLGVMTNIYSNIKNKKIKKRVSQSFHLQIAPFESWMTIVTLTRNLCCHHARVWNKQNTLRPMIPIIIVRPWINLPTDTLRIYFDMCIIKYFLNIISPGNDMLDKMQALFAEYPEVDLGALGGFLQLLPLGEVDESIGTRGWHFPLGSTGITSVGNGLFYVSSPQRKDGRESSTLILHRWTGDERVPLVPLSPQ